MGIGAADWQLLTDAGNIATTVDWVFLFGFVAILFGFVLLVSWRLTK